MSDESISLPLRESIQLSPDSVFVFHPRYANAEKTKVRALIRLNDGRFTEAETDIQDLRSPLRRDIFAQYTEDEIQYFTVRHHRLSEAKRLLDLRVLEDQKIASEREAVAQAKSQALSIPEVRDATDKTLRHRIRKAESVLEVTALTTMLLTMSFANQNTSANHADQ